MTMKHSIKYLLIPVLAMFMTGNCLSCSKDDSDSPDDDFKTYSLQVTLKAEDFVYHETATGTNEIHFMSFELTGVLGYGVSYHFLKGIEINGKDVTLYHSTLSLENYYYVCTIWKGHDEELWNYITSKSPQDEIVITVICYDV